MNTQLTGMAISIARLKFGGDDGVFNTACFQSAASELTGIGLGDLAAREMLSNHPNIQMLKGGCHWRYGELQ